MGAIDRNISTTDRLSKIGVEGEIIFNYEYADYGSTIIVYDQSEDAAWFVNLVLYDYFNSMISPKHYVVEGISKISLEDTRVLMTDGYSDSWICHDYQENLNGTMVYTVATVWEHNDYGDLYSNYVKTGVISDLISLDPEEVLFYQDYEGSIVYCVVQEEGGIVNGLA